MIRGIDPEVTEAHGRMPNEGLEIHRHGPSVPFPARKLKSKFAIEQHLGEGCSGERPKTLGVWDVSFCG
jgi:hypothetical protein